MTFKVYTRSDLASFTGRPLASFPANFVEASAIPQALLLFRLATGLTNLDGLSADQLQLVDFAIVSMADYIHLSSQHAVANASPFSSESLGSYSYSKMSKAVKDGEATGVEWFDLAVRELTSDEKDSQDIQRGGIELWEHQPTQIPGLLSGNGRFVSPADAEQYTVPGIGMVG